MGPTYTQFSSRRNSIDANVSNKFSNNQINVDKINTTSQPNCHVTSRQGHSYRHSADMCSDLSQPYFAA